MRAKMWEGNYGITIAITSKDAQSVSHSGQCDNDVAILSSKPYIKRQLKTIDPVKLSKELHEYGAWDDSELQNHTDNITRLLWIAGCDISEGRF